jgi:hypothetical protein
VRWAERPSSSCHHLACIEFEIALTDDELDDGKPVVGHA